MGFFDAFKKKQCSICGGEIGLLGNRKLEDGNMCKTCAAKLSPFFCDRRSSTVEQIKEQLVYREANKEAVENFHTTLSLGRDMKVLIDEDAGKFMVTRARNLKDANPDVMDFSQVTGVDMDIEEDTDEEKRKDNEGKYVSYNPPRYKYSYDFNMVIRVNHPYFDQICFQLNPSAVETNPENAVPALRKPDPRRNRDYLEYEAMGREIKQTLTSARRRVREEAQAAAAPQRAVTCPWCGATTTPDSAGCCEYCGGAVNA